MPVQPKCATLTIIEEYLFGAETSTDWKVGSKITFQGFYNEHQYCDKGTILENVPAKVAKKPALGFISLKRPDLICALENVIIDRCLLDVALLAFA
jgi:hypothetical protein